MTIASTAHAECRQPVGIDRLAQRIGLALVAWGERSLDRPEVSRADHELQRRAQQLQSAHDDHRVTMARRLF
jgi:hypothetical protein